MLAKNTKETAKIAKTFIRKILQKNTKEKGALVVGLSGDLGAGKTTFVQAVAKHLGVRGRVGSPTFVIIKKYLLPLQRGSARRARGSNFRFLFHLDAYRLKNEKELLHLGWEEIIKDENNLVFIEWPENVSKVIPQGVKSVHLSHKKNKQRIFKFGSF